MILHKAVRIVVLGLLLGSGLIAAGGPGAVSVAPAGASSCPPSPPKGAWQGTSVSTDPHPLFYADGTVGTIQAVLDFSMPNAVTGISKITGSVEIVIAGHTFNDPVTGTRTCANATFGATGADTFTGTFDPSGFTASGTYQQFGLEPTSSMVTDSGTWSIGALPEVNRIAPKKGPGAGGGTVVIHSPYKDFFNATDVSFGGVSSPSFMVNAMGNAIFATVPPHTAGMVDITVTGPGGTSPAVLADEYTYLAPTVMKLMPNHGAAGATVTIIGKYFQGATNVMFGSESDSNVLSNTGTRLTVLAPTDLTGPVNVSVQTPGGVSNAMVFTFS
jgi:hypothetical protein